MCVCVSKLPQFIVHGESMVKKNGWLILSHWKAEMFSVHVRPPGGPRPHPWRRRERTTKAPICQTSPGGTSWRSDQDLTQQKLGFSSSKSVSGLIFLKKSFLRFRKWCEKHQQLSWNNANEFCICYYQEVESQRFFPRFSTWDRLRFPRLNLPSLLLVI